MEMTESVPRWITTIVFALLALNALLAFFGPAAAEALGQGIGPMINWVRATIAAGYPASWL